MPFMSAIEVTCLRVCRTLGGWAKRVSRRTPAYSLAFAKYFS